MQRTVGNRFICTELERFCNDDAVERLLYAGEARETAKTLMKHEKSKIARRFKRLREELSSRTAGRDL